MSKLLHELGYVVKNHMQGPQLVVTKTPFVSGHVNFVIGGHVMEVELRELVNALSMVVKDAKEHGVVIVTPELPS